MCPKKFTLIIFGMQLLFVAQSKNDEEIVGLGGIAKLRAVAARAHLEHEIALHKLRAHLPHHLLLAKNPLEPTLNSTEPSLTPSELSETPESTWFEVNTLESSPELKATSTSSSDETTINYIQYEESTEFVGPYESTSHAPKDLVTKFRNHAFADVPDDVTEQAKSNMEVVSITTENFIYPNTSKFHQGSNLFGMRNGNSILASQSTKNSTVGDSNLKNDSLKSIGFQKLPLHLTTAEPNYESAVHHQLMGNKFSVANNSRGAFENFPNFNQNVRHPDKLNEDHNSAHGMPNSVTFKNPVHLSEENNFHETRNSFEAEIPKEKQNIEDDLVQRRQHLSRNRLDEELFVQHLNMMQSQDNQDTIRTAAEDNSYGNQNPQRVTFYPINWKSNEACESPVLQYELSPITYEVSSEEDADKPPWEKFRRLNEKMGDFQSGDYVEENGARAADPRHFHSHSLEIHHTKHVWPSTFHKRKEFSSKLQPSGHSAHFSFEKAHWKEPPSTFDQTNYGHFDKQAPSNFHSSSKSLVDKYSSPFGLPENSPSPTNFHSSDSFDKLHPHHIEDVPYPNNFHSSSKSQIAHSTVLTPPPSHITVNNQNNFISTEPINGHQNVQIAQGSGGAPISQAHSHLHQSPRGDQPFDRSNLGSPYLIQVPRNAYYRRFKRSCPLIRLFTDPNVQLDVPKTLENVGTVARNSLEDRRAPMYHMRNVVGSAKNTVLSTLKIPPHNAIVPSRYKIVDKFGNSRKGDAILRQTNDNLLGNEIAKTFQKVGNIVRESVRSGQETLQHVGDVFHNAKKAVSSTKYSAPRLLLPYARTPALKRNKPEKITLITPRFTDFTKEDELVGATQNDDFLKLGDIMDAVGVSNPERKNVGISRLALQRKIPIPDRKLTKPNLQSRFGDDLDLGRVRNAKKTDFVKRNEVDEVTDALATLKNTLGAKTLQDFLRYMKQKFLLEHLKDKLRRVGQDPEDENVGSGLALGNDLMKPFMGRPSKTELTNYFHKNGDSIEEVEKNSGVLGVTAINPQVYKNYFNETLKVDEKVRGLTDGALPEIATLNDDNKIGASEETRLDMKVPEKLKKPFMGKKIRKYFH